ncbi:amidohydrolase [Gammaproteobacteria bacterium]|nr:amidohydrolase [Gammaproteobacteria bacterium]
MKNIFTGISWLLVPFLSVVHAADFADTVYTNGKIYTVNEAQPWAEAVAIKDGKFIAVGSADDMAALTGDDTEMVDLAGGYAMPGIGDNHIHAGLTMPKRAFCALPGTFYDPTEEQTIDALKECIANYPDDREWFIGTGWSLPVMAPETLTREFLDELIPDRPAFIEDETGGHTAWFNTLAMEAAGVSKDTEDTAESFFSRTEDGDIKGVAFEGGLNPFLEAMPPFDTELRKIAFMKIFDEGTTKGITAFGDAYTFEPDLQAFQELKQEGKLNQHVVLYFGGNLGTAELTPVAELLRWWNSYDLPGHKAVKIGMDGAIESFSAPLIDGFTDPEKSAEVLVPAEPFVDYITELDAAGFQVKVHAIGDGSVRATLDGYEKVIEANGNNRLRHHMDHCSLIHPDDFHRFVDLDVSCSIWPPLNAPVDYNLGNIKPVLKPETWARMYANRDRIDAGLRLVNHTDAPGAVLWPWYGMEASVTRGVPGKPDVPKMSPEQAITVAEAIEAYTINVAWSMMNDEVTGSIETGKWADMIILNHNLLEIPETEIHKTEVQKTIFKGNVVYEQE